MPNVSKLITDKGVSFENAVVPTSWCCPSRASLLTGYFSHSTGVWENSATDPFGAWPAFAAAKWPERSLPVFLKDAGYRTGLFGKYLNEVKLAGKGYVPPGWDVYEAFLGGQYNQYRLSSDEQPNTGQRTYLTDELAASAVDFVRKSAPSPDPFFVYFAPFAPHHPYDPGPYAGASAPYLADVFEATSFPAPSYNQEDVDQYPKWVSRQPRDGWWRRQPTGPPLASIPQIAVRQQDTLMGVDAAVADLVDAVEAAGELDNTLFIFTSDNGYSWGEHRMLGKNTPYDSSVSVPLLLRFDGELPAARVSEQIVAANVDVFATILHFAGVKVASEGVPVTGKPRRGVVLESARWRSRPAYCSWRTAEAVYTRYADGFEEFFDYLTDPYEMRNLALVPGNEERLRRYREQARAECSPPPPGYRWPGSKQFKKPAGNVTAVRSGNGQVTLTWTAPSGLVTPSFFVEVSGADTSREPLKVCDRPRWPRGLKCVVTIPGALDAKFAVVAKYPSGAPRTVRSQWVRVGG